MRDFFGYERNARTSGQIASSEFAIVTVGARQSLVQSVNIDYGQTVETVTQVGDSAIYFLPGRAQGSVSVAKLVGAGGFLSGWRGTTCGKIEPISVAVSGGKCGFSGSGTVNFDGGLIERVSISMNAQSLQISETAQIKVASMYAS